MASSFSSCLINITWTWFWNDHPEIFNTLSILFIALLLVETCLLKVVIQDVVKKIQTYYYHAYYIYGRLQGQKLTENRVTCLVVQILFTKISLLLAQGGYFQGIKKYVRNLVIYAHDDAKVTKRFSFNLSLIVNYMKLAIQDYHHLQSLWPFPLQPPQKDFLHLFSPLLSLRFIRLTQSFIFPPTNHPFI